jgi:hypothetical protein
MAAALAGALACSAHAQKFAEYDDKCGSAPYGPSIPTDTSITDDKITELKADVLEFLKASDRYQDCITKLIEEGPTFKKEDPMEKKIGADRRQSIRKGKDWPGLQCADRREKKGKPASGEINARAECRFKESARL